MLKLKIVKQTQQKDMNTKDSSKKNVSIKRLHFFNLLRSAVSQPARKKSPSKERKTSD